MTDRASKRFLVLARVGDQSLHKTWIADRTCNRNWDLQLNAYGKDESRVQDGDLPTVIDRGMKFDSIVRHFKAAPELLDQYEYIMLPDDDLLMEARDINRLFETAVEYDLTMAAAAMTPKSYCSHAITLRCPAFKLRFVNYLEPMAVAIKSHYLKALLPMFEKHITGWGNDMIWANLMKDPPYRCAIVDAVPMVHTRPLHGGPLYSQFAKENIDPQKEVALIMGKFQNSEPAMIAYGGVLRNGEKVSGAVTRLLNGLYLLTLVGRPNLGKGLVRKGVGMVVRAVTRLGFKPQRLRPISPEAAASLGLEALEL